MWSGRTGRPSTGYRSVVKRRLLTLAIFLLLGAVVNVAVAWIAAMVPINVIFGSLGLMERADAPRWEVRMHSQPGALLVESNITLWRRVWGEPRRAPHWSRAALPPTKEDVAASPSIIEKAYGWPMLSQFHRNTRWRGNREATTEWCITVPWPSQYTRTRALPLLPIWPGFAFNTLFYAAILWPLICGPFALRRVIRRKRGLCVACGYDLRGNLVAGCPECGWRREAAS